jgi:DNA ligase (NAD+)
MDILELKNKIEDANLAYRSGNPIMSDTEYDTLVDTLFQISPTDDFFINIGHEVNDRKIKLPIEMASMNKIKTLDELFDWTRLKSINTSEIVVITPKYDGLSLGVNDFNGNAFTRGDGQVGQESSEHFKFIGNKLNLTNDLAFEYSYGEVIMPKDVFNKKYSDKFANPRNLVAGLINSKEGFEGLSDCNFIRYGIQNIKKNIFTTKTQILDYLNNLQPIKVNYKLFRIADITEQILVDTFKEWSIDYEIDGLIIEVNDLNKQLVLGRETSTNNPTWARAFKHASFEEAVVSEVVGITWNISKQGYLKPIINIKPVRIDGVLVSNVTGNNARYIKEMGIGVGSMVKVVRSGMVIPKIIQVLLKKEFTMPDFPNIAWDDRGIDLITLEETEEQQFKKIVAFFSILETENVSEGVLAQLWDNGYRSIKSILNLTKDDLSKLDGFGKRKAEIVANSIKKSVTNIEVSKLMHASSLFGGLGSKKLALLEHFDTKPSIEDIIKIEGFAEKSAKIYVDNYDLFNIFVKDLPITLNKKVSVSTGNLPLEGTSFVFTGVRRPDLVKVIAEKGGREVSSVSKNTTHLICVDKNSNSSKMVKARELGVKILDVNDLENLLKNI